MAIVAIVSFLVALLVGVPLMIALGLACVIFMCSHAGIPLIQLPQQILAGLDSSGLVCVGLFLLAGMLLNYGGATDRLVVFANSLVGHLTGSLAHVTVVANLAMSGMTGSATADVTATGAVLIPTMVESGYPRGFAAAVTASASTIGPLVPPSLTLIVLGSVTNVSIARLFIGGIAPALLMAVYLMIAVYLISRRRRYGVVSNRASLRFIAVAFWKALPALGAVVVVVGGIVAGVFTPTEAGAVAATYAFIIGTFVYKGLRLRQYPALLREILNTNASIMMTIAIFGVAGWLFALEGLPNRLAGMFHSMTSSTILFLLLVNLILLLLGLVVEPLPLVIIMAPLLLPVAVSYHVDPVQFGVMFTLNVMLGLLHPPIGLNMFIASHIAKASVGEFTVAVLPFLLALLIVLALVTYIPAVATALPNALF